MSIDPALVARLRAFAHALVDPAHARVAIPAERPEKGFWFGGGKMAQDAAGRLWLTGRYRSAAVTPEGEPALSIEGSALRFVPGGVELYVSSEKRLPYPAAVAEYRKPGTGVWTIERLRAPSVAQLAGARTR